MTDFSPYKGKYILDTHVYMCAMYILALIRRDLNVNTLMTKVQALTVHTLMVLLMKYRKSAYFGIAVLVCLVALPCMSSPSQPDLSERCAQALVGVGRPAVATLAASGSRIRIGGKVLRLRAQIEDEESAETKSLIGLRVDVFVDDVFQPLTYGSVGVGNDREDAISTAVSEWAAAVGEALLGGLGVKINQKPERIGPFLVYRGPAGIRSSDHVIWSSENDNKLLLHLRAFVQGLEHTPGELHAISLMVLVSSDGATQGECRIDGVISPSLLKAIQSFPWGQHGGVKFVFKQFYVVRRT
jgi:Family of unknown function (DUF6348)